MHSGNLTGAVGKRHQRVLVTHVAQIDADVGLAAQQLPQLRHRKAVACVNAHDALALWQYFIELGFELLREVLQLWAQARLEPLPGPDQLLTKLGQARTPPLLPFDQRRAEERGPFLDEIPAMSIRHLRMARGACDFAGGADLVEKVEHHQHGLAIALAAEAPDGLDLDADHSDLPRKRRPAVSVYAFKCIATWLRPVAPEFISECAQDRLESTYSSQTEMESRPSWQAKPFAPRKLRSPGHMFTNAYLAATRRPHRWPAHSANCIRQRPQQRRPISPPRTAVHARQSPRLFVCQPLQECACLRSMCEIIERLTEILAWPEDISLGQRDIAGAALREKVATEERSGTQLRQQPALPPVRHVRCVEPLHRVTTQCELLGVAQRARRFVREVVD